MSQLVMMLGKMILIHPGWVVVPVVFVGLTVWWLVRKRD